MLPQSQSQSQTYCQAINKINPTLQRRAIRKLEEGTGAVAVVEDAGDTEECWDLSWVKNTLINKRVLYAASCLSNSVMLGSQ
jgi:hypothetical protein